MPRPVISVVSATVETTAVERPDPNLPGDVRIEDRFARGATEQAVADIAPGGAAVVGAEESAVIGSEDEVLRVARIDRHRVDVLGVDREQCIMRHVLEMPVVTG